MKMLGNPLVILLMPVMLAIIYASFVFGPMLCLVDTSHSLNWPHIMAAMFWISTFSGGLLGTIYHAKRLLVRGGHAKADLSRLSVLSANESKVLVLWIQGKIWEFRGKTLLPVRFSHE